MRWFLLASLLVVSTSAFLAPPSGSAPTSTGNNNAVSNNRLPDMNMVMQLVRQILSLLIPKLMANPSLMQALAGGNGNGVMGGGMGMPPPQNNFYPQRPPMSPGMSAMGDKFKDMRITELIQSPAIGLMNDPMVASYIPRGGVPFGWSLPDRGKDAVLYSLHRKQMAGTLPPEGQELMHLIGDVPMGPRY